MARKGARSEAGAERKGTKIRRKTGVPVTVWACASFKVYVNESAPRVSPVGVYRSSPEAMATVP